MTLRLNGNTSGYAEIDAPAVAGSNTLVLPASNGSAYQFLRNGATAGTTEFAAAITSGTAVASTSGTSIDFTSIPSYVKRITVMFDGVSTNGGSNYQIRIGDAGGIENTGYVGGAFDTSVVIHSSTGAVITSQNINGVNYNGFILISNLSGNIWVFSGAIVGNASGYAASSGNSKTLSDTLTQVRITTVNGTDTFDAGSINILYEG